MPRASPSVESIATARTRSSPRCCCTSAIRSPPVGARDPQRGVDRGQAVREDGVDHDALDLDQLADVLAVAVRGHESPGNERASRRERGGRDSAGRQTTGVYRSARRANAGDRSASTSRRHQERLDLQVLGVHEPTCSLRAADAERDASCPGRPMRRDVESGAATAADGGGDAGDAAIATAARAREPGRRVRGDSPRRSGSTSGASRSSRVRPASSALEALARGAACEMTVERARSSSRARRRDRATSTARPARRPSFSSSPIIYSFRRARTRGFVSESLPAAAPVYGCRSSSSRHRPALERVVAGGVVVALERAAARALDVAVARLEARAARMEDAGRRRVDRATERRRRGRSAAARRRRSSSGRGTAERSAAV